MAVEYFNPDFLHDPPDPTYAHLSKSHGSTIYRIGGQVPVSADGKNLAVGDMPGQIRACYECVQRSLAFFDLEWTDITHLLIFTTDVDAYIEHERNVAPDFLKGNPPPSTLVEVARLVDREWLVEIQADAISKE